MACHVVYFPTSPRIYLVLFTLCIVFLTIGVAFLMTLSLGAWRKDLELVAAILSMTSFLMMWGASFIMISVHKKAMKAQQAG